jgi:hypothetical protein
VCYRTKAVYITGSIFLERWMEKIIFKIMLNYMRKRQEDDELQTSLRYI